MCPPPLTVAVDLVHEKTETIGILKIISEIELGGHFRSVPIIRDWLEEHMVNHETTFGREEIFHLRIVWPESRGSLNCHGTP